MIFMQDLPMCELEQLGRVFIEKKLVAKMEKLAIENGGVVPEADEIRVNQEHVEKKRMMMCAVGMYWHANQVAEKNTFEQGLSIYLTPAHFLLMFHYHERLLFDK